MASAMVVLAVGWVRVDAGTLRLGDLLGFVAYLEVLYTPVIYLALQLPRLQRANAALDRTFETSELLAGRAAGTPARDAAPGEGPAPVELRDLCVEHPASPGTNILDYVSWRAPTGELIALTGPNASGKTTLLDVLAGVRQPSSGQLLVDRGDEDWSTAGGDIVLTLDVAMQSDAALVLREAIAATGARGGVVVTLDPFTGDVPAPRRAPARRP